jgi:outer membrane receptor protein involved in Fe transport
MIGRFGGGVGRTLAAALMLSGAPVPSGVAGAQVRAEALHDVDLPAGTLEASLIALGRQTGHQLFFTQAEVAGRQVPALQGRYSAEAAAARLAADAELSVSRAGPHVLVLQRRSPAPAPHTPAQAAEGEARPFVTAAGGAPLASLGTGPTAAAPIVLDELLVTGSHIRGGRTASPVTVLDGEALARTGRATVGEALRTLPANFAGGAGDGAVSAGADAVRRNTAFGTGINLRGLGNSATLVLVNGRRVAGSGAFGDFTDVSTIPTAAVARVEVLLDGASALYGSDAVGGVVNIILRTDYQGAETRLLVGGATAGEPLQGQISQVLGHRWGSGGVMLAYELQRRDNLPGAARAFSRSADLRPLGGSDFRTTAGFPGTILRPDPTTGALAPGWAIPAGQDGRALSPGDFRPGEVNLGEPRLGLDLLPRQTVNAVWLAADQGVGERLTLSADARFGSRRFKFLTSAPTSTLTVSRANPFFVSPNGSASHPIAYSFAGQLPPGDQSGLVETLTASVGARLELPRGWVGDGYVAYGREHAEFRAGGLINLAFLAEALGNAPDRPDTPYSAVRDGFFNPFVGAVGVNSPALLAWIGSGALVQRTTSQTATASLKVEGPLWATPAGDIRLAVGGQARREDLARGGYLFVTGPSPSESARVEVARDVLAGFAELRVPLVSEANARPGLHRLELSLAGRVEDYEAVGTTANPKVGVIWAPAEGLQFRATYGTSFRAPALRETEDPPLYSPTLLPLGSGRLRTLILQGGNRDLEPETARSWALGFDWEPARWPKLRVSGTGFDVRFEDRISQPVAQNLIGALGDPTLSAFVRRISPGTDAADRALIESFLSSPFLSTLGGVFPAEAYGAIVDNRYVNTSALKVRGLDLTARYAFAAWGGELTLGANGTYLFRYREQVTPTAPVLDRVDLANFPVRLRGRLTADWTRDRLTAGLALNYVDPYRDAAGTRIDGQHTVDLQLRLAPPARGPLRDVALTVNVRNLFDDDPPFYDNPIGVGYDGSNADPVGRFVSVQLTRSW